MELSNIVHFITVSALLTLAPGPDILFVIAQSVSHGRKAGIVTALGLCSGIVFHTLAAALGISAIVYQSALAFQIVKIAGAIYLFYLAIQAWKERNRLFAGDAAPSSNAASLYRKGIFMNLLNPKVSLFFVAFLPQFVSVDQGHIPLQMVVLGFIFMIQAVFIFTVVSIFSGSLTKRVIENHAINKCVSVGKAILYALIGLRLIVSEK